MKRFIHKATPMDMLDRYSRTVESAERVCGDSDIDSDQYELIDKKSVMDSDGFYTDYCLYYDVLNDRYVTVFGDSDIYRPEDEDFDMECETEAEAREWFDSYHGFDEEY